jgi:hypothetical protein
VEVKASEFGINGGWAGIRTTAAFVDKFSENTSYSWSILQKRSNQRESKT